MRYFKTNNPCSGIIQDLIAFYTSVQCAISQNTGIMKTEIEKQFLTVHFPLYYKIILMISTKLVNSAFKGSFYINVGAINCANNVRKIGQFRKRFNAAYSLWHCLSISRRNCSLTASLTVLMPMTVSAMVFVFPSFKQSIIFLASVESIFSLFLVLTFQKQNI